MRNNFIVLRLFRSLSKVKKKHILIVKALGLFKINSINILPNIPSVRFILKKVYYIVELIFYENF